MDVFACDYDFAAMTANERSATDELIAQLFSALTQGKELYIDTHTEM